MYRECTVCKIEKRKERKRKRPMFANSCDINEINSITGIAREMKREINKRYLFVARDRKAEVK